MIMFTYYVLVNCIFNMLSHLQASTNSTDCHFSPLVSNFHIGVLTKFEFASKKTHISAKVSIIKATPYSRKLEVETSTIYNHLL